MRKRLAMIGALALVCAFLFTLFSKTAYETFQKIQIGSPSEAVFFDKDCSRNCNEIPPGKTKYAGLSKNTIEKGGSPKEDSSPITPPGPKGESVTKDQFPWLKVVLFILTAGVGIVLYKRRRKKLPPEQDALHSLLPKEETQTQASVDSAHVNWPEDPVRQILLRFDHSLPHAQRRLEEETVANWFARIDVPITPTLYYDSRYNPKSIQTFQEELTKFQQQLNRRL